MNRIYLITHDDLDGAGCSVLLHLLAASSTSWLEVQYCTHLNVDDNTLDFVQDIMDNYSKRDGEIDFYITDICPSVDVLQHINLLRKEYGVRTHFIDHHSTSVNKATEVDWSYIDIQASTETCATTMLRKYLSETTPLDWLGGIESFCNDVLLVDCWKFPLNARSNADDLNVLLQMLQTENFTKIILEWFSVHESDYVVEKQSINAFVTAEIKNRTKYREAKVNSAKIINYKDYRVAAVFAEKDRQAIGDMLLDKYDVDFTAVIDFPNIVLRTRQISLNLGKDVALELGGGGHKKAAGYDISWEIKEIIEMLIFNHKKGEK